jgi:hypothetical protein
MNGRILLALACLAFGISGALACSAKVDDGPVPDAASPSGDSAVDSSAAGDAVAGDGAQNESTAPRSDGSTQDARQADAGHADASPGDASPRDVSPGTGEGGVLDSGGAPDSPSGIDCAEAGVLPVMCAQGSPCNCYPECSMSEGTGPSACSLLCTCNASGYFDCTQDCPPDAAPPAHCVQGVTCVPGVECGGNPPVCLCDNTGHLQCPPGWDGGS